MDINFKINPGKIVTIALIIILSALFASYLNYINKQNNPAKSTPLQLATGTLISVPHTLDILEQHAKVNDKLLDLHGQWSFVFFGKPNCLGACRDTQEFLKQVQDYLEKNTQLPHSQLVFITTEEQKINLDSKNSQLISAVLNTEQLRKTIEQLSKIYAESSYSSDQQYSTFNFSHSENIALINPKGEIQAVFPMPNSVEGISNDVILLAQHSG